MDKVASDERQEYILIRKLGVCAAREESASFAPIQSVFSEVDNLAPSPVNSHAICQPIQIRGKPVSPQPSPPSEKNGPKNKLGRGEQDERKTRTAYKDKMKREAFDLINHIAGNCDLHETVTVRAKELFAGWRNVK